ncbi:hypothetical protein KI387_037222, partial [Taxus chinensis]
LEGFDDFTLASSWERLISDIEAVCRMWLADGAKYLLEKGAECVKASKNLYRVKADFTYGIKTYVLDYFFKDDNSHADIDQWSDGLHFLQMWFGVKDFLIISPQSMSRVILDAPEATKLLSAVAIALSNCGSILPAFVPVHDPTRKAYKGIQNIKTTLVRRFEADRIGSHVPVKLMHMEGLYELFVSKLSLFWFFCQSLNSEHQNSDSIAESGVGHWQCCRQRESGGIVVGPCTQQDPPGHSQRGLEHSSATVDSPSSAKASKFHNRRRP